MHDSNEKAECVLTLILVTGLIGISVKMPQLYYFRRKFVGFQFQ